MPSINNHLNELYFEENIALELEKSNDLKLSPFENKLKKKLRKELYVYLKEDLVRFLSKVISDDCAIKREFKDFKKLNKSIFQVLKELGIYNIFQSYKKYEKSTLVEKWFNLLQKQNWLNANIFLTFIKIYKSRLYVLLDESSYQNVVISDLIFDILRDSDIKLSFNEIYMTEMSLQDKILESLLEDKSNQNPVDYWYYKKIIQKMTNDYIILLHNQILNVFVDDLNIKEKDYQKILKRNQVFQDEFSNAARYQKRNIQKKLPNDSKQIKFEICYEYLMDVGGDYYRIFKINTNEYFIFLADITGHGITAVMHYNTLHYSFEKIKSEFQKVDLFMTRINNDLFGKLGGNFVTAIAIHINLLNKEITYCNSGHPKAFLYNIHCNDSNVRFLRPNSKVLGILENTNFREEKIKYDGHVRLVAYTDGITETFNEEGILFGERGMLNALKGCDSLSLKDSILSVKEHLALFLEGENKQDDRCMIIAEIEE